MFKQREYFKNGGYEVELPWKGDNNESSDKLNLEKRRLESPMRKMQSVFDTSACERRNGSEKSDEDMELPQATERVLPLESERAKMLSVGPDYMAQSVTVPEEKGLSRVQLISADERCEEKGETSVDVIKETAKEDINTVVLGRDPLNLDDDEKEVERTESVFVLTRI
ncbi:uncharacterized protein TNCV_3443351 [Trichonephila clavipes]|nr:uncharacterized protein TNCV_3443351 [Trichonephila clavipes]